MKSFYVQLDQIQPSQLYISKEKLNNVLHSNQALPPVSIKELDGQLIFTDGHTRALVALIKGQEAITAVWEEDLLDWEAYQICVAWCLEEDIHTIADLKSRIVDPLAYQSLWLDRCRQMHNTLEKRR